MSMIPFRWCSASRIWPKLEIMRLGWIPRADVLGAAASWLSPQAEGQILADESGVVQHSKISGQMSHMGHDRPTQSGRGSRACPLRSDSDPILHDINPPLRAITGREHMQQTAFFYNFEHPPSNLPSSLGSCFPGVALAAA